MHYTKLQRINANLTIDLTIDNLVQAIDATTHALAIANGQPYKSQASELIAKATYHSHGRLRVRLVNSDPDIQQRPALYNYSLRTIAHLQQFRNVGPWSNEYIANSKYTNYRRLDLYLDQRDIDTISLPDTEILQALPSLQQEVSQC